MSDALKKIRLLGNFRDISLDLEDTLSDVTLIINRQGNRIEELEAKLAKAVETLGIAAEWLDDYSAFTGNTYETTKSKTVRVAIAKIKGE